MAREEVEYTIKIRDEQASGDGGSGSGTATSANTTQIFGSTVNESGRGSFGNTMRGIGHSAMSGAASSLGALTDPFASQSEKNRRRAVEGASAVGAAGAGILGIIPGVDGGRASELGEKFARAAAEGIVKRMDMIEGSARGDVGGVGRQLARQGVDRETINALMKEMMPVAARAAGREANTMEDLSKINDPSFFDLDKNKVIKAVKDNVKAIHSSTQGYTAGRGMSAED